jgi:hypothetical protein
MNLPQRLAGLVLAATLAGLAACGSPGIPRPPSLDLPQPASDLRAVRKGDRAYLVWTIPNLTTDGLAVRRAGATRICRSVDLAMSECGNPVGEVAAPQAPLNSTTKTTAANVQARYMDQIPATILSGNSEARLFYAVAATNQRGRDAGLSNQVSVPGFTSTAPPEDFRAQVTAEGVVLSWSGGASPQQAAQVERIYRVYRREEGTDADAIAGETAFTAGPPFRMLDQTFQWEKKYGYRVTVLTRIRLADKSESEFEGDDTPAVEIFAHDVFPPAVPSGLQAVFSGVGQQAFVDLIWAPDTEADLAGYNVYRREADGTTAKINAEPVKTPAFRDSKVIPGHTYVYSLTAVDLRGNESERSAEASENVP